MSKPPICTTQSVEVDSDRLTTETVGGSQSTTISFPGPIQVFSSLGDNVLQLNGFKTSYVMVATGEIYQTIILTAFIGGRYSGLPRHPPSFAIHLFTLDGIGGLLDDWSFTSWNQANFPHAWKGELTFKKPINPDIRELAKKARVYLPAATWGLNS